MNKALSSYTQKEDELLCNYIGEARPSEAGRLGNAIYQTLVENVCLSYHVHSVPTETSMHVGG